MFLKAFLLTTLLSFQLVTSARAEVIRGEITRFSPSEGQPIFPVGNLNFFKQYVVSSEAEVEFGESTSTLIGDFGANFYTKAGAAFGLELGLCLGGSADYDLAFRPTVTVPDEIPQEYPVTLVVDPGLMSDSNFRTHFPPLGAAYVDLIIDIELQMLAKVCVFGCFKLPAIFFSTCALPGTELLGLPLPSVDAEILSLFKESIRCDPAIKEQAYCALELLSWNRDGGNQFKYLNLPALLDGKRTDGTSKTSAERLSDFLREPRKEFGFGGSGPDVNNGGAFSAGNVQVDWEADTLSYSQLNGGGPVNGAKVRVSYRGALPPLQRFGSYYLRDVEGTQFKLAQQKGGPAIDFKDPAGFLGEELRPGSIKVTGQLNRGIDSRDVAGAIQANTSLSLSAPTITSDSRLSSIDPEGRPVIFNTASNNVQAESGESLAEAGYVAGDRIRFESSDELPAGLLRQCYYYLVEGSGGAFGVSSNLGGNQLAIADVGSGEHTLFRVAEFNSEGALISSGAEEIASFKADLVGILQALTQLPFSGSVGLPGIPASVDYSLLGLSLGPSMELKTDFALSWDVVVDDIIFREPDGMAEKEVRFLHSSGDASHSRLRSAFPGREFHLTNEGDKKLPEIALLSPGNVKATVCYSVKPKLQTTVSLPMLGGINFSMLELGASISVLGGISFGPLVDVAASFGLAEATIYESSPTYLQEGTQLREGPFTRYVQREKYDLIVVPTEGQLPDSGCGQVYISEDTFKVIAFDLESGKMESCSGDIFELHQDNQILSEIITQTQNYGSSLNPNKKDNLLELITRKPASQKPNGVFTFVLKNAGPADYQWDPVYTEPVFDEPSIPRGGFLGVIPLNPNDPANTREDPSRAPWQFPYEQSGPRGEWTYGYLVNGSFQPFPESWWDSNEGGRFIKPGNTWPFLSEDEAHPGAGGEAMVRRWTSPGGTFEASYEVLSETFSGDGVSVSFYFHDGETGAYEFRQGTLDGTFNESSSLEFETKAGDSIDFVVDRFGTTNDDTVRFLTHISSEPPQTYTWATVSTLPSNWTEFLTGNHNKPGAYPGSVSGDVQFKASNVATIDKAPYPSLQSEQDIGHLNVKEGARLDIIDGGFLSVDGGTVENDGRIDMRGILRLGHESGCVDVQVIGGGYITLDGGFLVMNGSIDRPHSAFIKQNIFGHGYVMSSMGGPHSLVVNAEQLAATTPGKNLNTSAEEYRNEGTLIASGSQTRLKAEGLLLTNAKGGTLWGWDGGLLDLTFDEVEHLGFLRADNGGTVEVMPRAGQSMTRWMAGDPSSDKFGLFELTKGAIRFENACIDGGLFKSPAQTGGFDSFDVSAISFTDSQVNGARIENRGKLQLAGAADDGGGFILFSSVNGAETQSVSTSQNRFRRTALINHGEVKVERSQASFTDSLLFENHGTVKVGPDSTLTIEGDCRTDSLEDGELAGSQAGLANVANGILLGGTWKVDGKLDMVGVSLSKIGSDTPATSSGTGSEGGQVINQPVATDSLISGGQPAQVTLSGTAASFPALLGLEVNCGGLLLNEGANLVTAGDLINYGDIELSTFGTGFAFGGGTSDLWIGGTYIQKGPAASLKISAGSQFNAASQEYHVLGGSVEVVPEILEFGEKVLRLQSTFVREEEGVATIDPVSVSFIGRNPTTIAAGVDLTVHGKEVTFPRSLTSNQGKLTVSGDYGSANAGRLVVEENFENLGEVTVLGSASSFRAQMAYLQTSGWTRVGEGATLSVGSLDCQEGEVIVEIGARPHHEGRFGKVGRGSLDFGGHLVFDFQGDFLGDERPDYGDTWEIAPSSALVTGVDAVTYRVGGEPLPAGWLPPQSRFVVEPVRGNGLQLRLARTTEDGATEVVPQSFSSWGEAVFSAYSTFSSEERQVARKEYLYGEDLDGGFDTGLVTDAASGDEFYRISYRRRTSIDSTLVTYMSQDLKNWFPAPMVVEEVIPEEGDTGFETVILRSTFPLPDERVFFEVRTYQKPISDFGF